MGLFYSRQKFENLEIKKLETEIKELNELYDTACKKINYLENVANNYRKESIINERRMALMDK